MENIDSYEEKRKKARRIAKNIVGTMFDAEIRPYLCFLHKNKNENNSLVEDPAYWPSKGIADFYKGALIFDDSSYTTVLSPKIERKNKKLEFVDSGKIARGEKIGKDLGMIIAIEFPKVDKDEILFVDLTKKS